MVLSKAKATLKTVTEAAVTILSKGEELSISAIRARTAGSRNTVHKYLKEIREEMEAFSAAGMDLPAALRETLITFERTVWKDARTAAGEDFLVERDRLHRYLEDGERNLGALLEQNGELQAALDNAQRSIEAQSGLLAQRDRELAKVKKLADGLRAQVAGATRAPRRPTPS